MSKYGGNNRIDFGVHFNTDKSSLAEVQKAFQKLQDIKPANFKGSKEELVQIKLQALKVENALTKAFNVKLGSLNVEKFKNELKGLNIDKIYTDLSRLGSQGQVAFSKMATSMMTTNLQLRETHSLINSMGTTMMNTVKWGIASSVMNNFTQSVSQAFQYVKSLDSALTDIRIVTGDSTDQMAKFADQANRAAQELGRSTMDYSKAALTFYQQGLSDEDVAARTEATLKAQNITGAGEEMADYLTAVWNGYKVANEEAELYVDKLAAVADSSASNMSQLAVAMSKVASTANLLGVPIDSLNAQIATIVATTRQAPETVGNALKTIYARINDIKTGSDDAEVSLGNYTSQMAQLGINVLDASGNLRDTGDVIEQIGGKWENLSREQQIYLARTMAGQRQYNNLLALFENWGKYTDLVNVSMQSQGTTMEKNSRYMDSLAAHMEQLGAAGERVKSAMIDSDSFKGLIDIGTALTNTFANLIEGIGGGGNALLMLGGVLTSVFSPVISREINNLVVNMQAAKSNADILRADLEQTKLLGQSLGYQQGTIKEIVDAKQSLGVLYTTITQEERNAYNQALMNVAAAKEALIPVQEQVDLAKEYEESFTKVGISADNFKQKIILIQAEAESLGQIINTYSRGKVISLFGDVSKNEGQITDYVNVIQNQVEQLRNSLTEKGQTLFAVDEFKKFDELVANFDPTAENAKNKILEIRDAAQALNSTISNANNASLSVEGNINQQERLRSQLDLTIQKANELKEGFQQGAGIQNAVNLFGQLGRTIGSLMGMMNGLKNVWSFIKDPTAEGSLKKLVQGFMSLGVSIPMITKTFEAMKKTTLGVSQAFLNQTKILELKKAVEAAQNKVAETHNAVLKAQQQGYVMLDGQIMGETMAKELQTKATLEADAAQKQLNATMALNPMGKWLLIIAGVTAGIVALVKVVDYFTMSTKEAEQAINKFNEKQKEFHDSTKTYKEQVAALSEMRNQYEVLAQKAGAATGDNRIDSLTQAERQRYNELKNTIAEYNDEAVAGYNAKGQVILKNNQALDETLDKLQKIHQEEAKEFFNSNEYEDYKKAKNQQYEAAKGKYESEERINKEQGGYASTDKSRFDTLKSQMSNAFTDITHDSKYAEQQEELREIYNEWDTIAKDGLGKLRGHEDQLKNLQSRLAKILSEEDLEDFKNYYFKDLYNLIDMPDDGPAKMQAAKAELEKAAAFDPSIIISGLEQTGKNEEYKALSQAYGQDTIDSLIQGYVSGLSRADFQDEDAVIEDVRKNFLKSLQKAQIKSEDLEKFKNQSASALEDADLTGLSPDKYQHELQGIIQEVINGNSKLKALAKDPQTRGAFEALIKSQFGLTDVKIDENGVIESLTNDAIKAGKEAKNKLEIALKDEQITLSTKQSNNINRWINDQDVQTLANFDSILEKVKQDGQFTAEAFQKAKNEVNNMAASEALSGAAGLLQKKARGEDLDQEEQGQLSSYLSQLKTLIPQYKEVVEILQNDYLQGTKYYQHAIEQVVNGTLTMMAAAKNARIEDEESKFKKGEIGASEINRGPTDSQSAEALKLVENTENLQTAQSKGLLTTEDYSKGLQKLASQYESCNTELSQYAQALAHGDEQSKKNAESTLLLSVRAAELAEKSGLSANQIESTAAWLAKSGQFTEEYSQKLRENSQLAADAAQRYLRLNNAYDDLYTNGDKYKELMAEMAASGQDVIYANEDLYNTFDQFKTQVADIFDTEKDFLSDDFVARHMQEIQAAAQQGKDISQELREEAAQEIVMHLGLDDYDFMTNKEKVLGDIAALPEGFDIGMNLDLLNWTQNLVLAMQQAGYSQSQIQSALSGIGIDVDLAPYEQGLNKAIDDAKQAGKYAGAGFAANAGTDIKVNKQTFTDEDEDLQEIPEYKTQEVTGDYYYPVIHASNAPFGPQIDSVEQGHFTVRHPNFKPVKGQVSKNKKQTTTTAHALEVVSATKSGGGKIASYNKPAQRSARKARGSGGGGGKKGGGGSSAKPSIAKTNTTKIDTKKKTQENDPYYKVNKSLDKQSTLLKRLQDQEKNLSGKDRLKNLEAQAKNLKEQNELLEQRNRISNNVAAENSTANLRKRLQDAFGKNISFDSEGKIADLNQTERAAVDSYNKAAQQAQSTFEAVQKQYNNWILHTWNANSKAWQEAHQSEKEQWDERIKNAETNAKDAISAAEEEYKKKTDLIKAYEKALQEDQKRYEQYMNNVRKIMQDTFEKRKIKIQFKLDSGELERDWLDFENKVIRKIKDSDIVGNAAAQFRELSSYIQSKELQSVSDEIKAISDDIARVNAGAWTQLMGISQTDYEMLKPEDQQLVRKEALGMLEEQLKELVKQEQDALSAIQDLTDEIAESYLDSIDAAKDALDEHIDQYERINDLIEHNVKLTELLYGDKGYDTLNKYYDLQKQNNMNTLQTLKQQEEYWRSRMQNEVVGSEAWKKFKENLDNAVDAVNSKLEDMLDNLTTQFEKKLAAAVERVNNKLTGGLGTSYLDEQWDYLNNYDDYFLDTYNATTGIEDVTRAYQQALDDAAANPKQQQRLNKLMNDQLKILREKDHLTEYDLERAKSMLEVEKARMALEDARNNKTKMRLRRDSQGNYTYQYVADEEKLGDLQQALADAQNDLYNQDKEHYKENLNTLYDTYKEYLEKMQQLTEEYRQAQAEAEATGNDTWLKQVQTRIDLAKEYYNNTMTGLLEDNEYNQTYITQSFANGLNLDLSGLSSEEAWGVIQENVPWAASNIQNLANSISNLGGLLPATNALLQDFSSAAAQYKTDMNDILEAGGTSIQTIGQVINEQGGPLDTNIIEANSQVIMGYLDEITKKALTDVNTMQDLTQKLDEYWQNLNNNIQTYINNTREGYNTLQELLDSSTRAEVLDYIVPQTNTTSTEGLTQAKEQLSLENISGEDIKALYDSYLSYLQNTNGALEVPRSQVQYQQLAENQQQLQEQYDRFYTDLVQDMIQQVSSMSIDSQIDQMTAGTSQLLSNLIKNQSLLDQNVHIDANFPNVNNHTQIEEAFNNLVNMAAMRASGYRD